MPRTKLSDINFESPVWKGTFQAEFTNQLALLSGGVMREAPANLLLENETAYTSKVTNWNTILSDSTVQITTNTTTTFNNLGNWYDELVWVEREVAWSAEEIINMITGDDVNREVARQVARYIATFTQGLGISVFNGVFATALATTHTYNDSGNTINISGLLNARQKLGDAKKALTLMAMNSKVESDAVRDKILTYDKANVETYRTGMTGDILGMLPFSDDDIASVAGVYNNYLSAPGSIVYKFRDKPKSDYSDAQLIRLPNGAYLELYRDSLTAGGVDGLILRMSACAHIPGVRWNGTVASNPTDAQLATGANWTKCAPDDKLIKIVNYKCD